MPEALEQSVVGTMCWRDWSWGSETLKEWKGNQDSVNWFLGFRKRLSNMCLSVPSKKIFLNLVCWEFRCSSFNILSNFAKFTDRKNWGSEKMSKAMQLEGNSALIWLHLCLVPELSTKTFFKGQIPQKRKNSKRLLIFKFCPVKSLQKEFLNLVPSAIFKIFYMFSFSQKDIF